MSTYPRSASQQIYLAVKRGLDIVFALAALLPSCVVILLYAVAVKLEDGGPVFFRQERLGRGGKVFRMLKLRTMQVNAEHTGSGVYSGSNDPRVLKVGRLARKTSIDELPQLINILRGDMSFIGPRPPLTYHPWPLAEYTEEQRHMFDVRPGLTGWAQVNGRKGVEWHRRIELSCYYARHISPLLDGKIFLMTFGELFRFSHNVNVEATVQK